MKATILPLVIGTLGTVTKGLVQELDNLEITGRVETVQTTALLRSAKDIAKEKKTLRWYNTHKYSQEVWSLRFKITTTQSMIYLTL